MIDFRDGELVNLLGPNYRSDPEVAALSYAIKQGMGVLLDGVIKCASANIDGLSEDVLDLMAAELRTQYYDQTLDVEKKRELVKNTLRWHAHTGTATSMEQMASVVFGEDAGVEEWYTYGGDPYCFRISLDGPIQPPESYERLFGSVLSSVKNVRSHYDGQFARRSTDTAVNIIPLVKQTNIVHSWDLTYTT